MADRRLQVFHAVAKHGSFTRAAEHLHMTQPAVTFQIKQLEEHFDTRLLDRGHGKISLTPAGELVLAYAERILGLSAELDSRVSELTDELAGQIKIGTSTTIAAYWLPHILEGFKRRYPRVLPRVVVGNSKLTEDAVAARDLDIGLIEIVTEQHAIERRSAARDELFVICSPDNPLAAFKSLRAKDLVGHPFIDRDPGNGIRQIADEFFEAAGIAEDGDATSSEAIDMFLQRWRAGDSDVAKVVDQAADALVSAIASAVNLVDVDTVLLGGLWTHFGDELATVLEGRLRSEILGYPNVKIRVFVPPVALHPSLYGAAEMGLRRFIENPLGYMGEK